MCNTCQMNRSTCVYQNNGFCNGLFNTLFGNTRQSICRDCCGNVRTNPCYQTPCGCTPCGCTHCCPQNCGCGCQGGCNNGNNANNGNGTGNGGFACVTYCGNTANTSTAQTTSTGATTDWYYARQYGLYPRQHGCCRCGGASAYNSFVNVTD